MENIKLELMKLLHNVADKGMDLKEELSKREFIRDLDTIELGDIHCESFVVDAEKLKIDLNTEDCKEVDSKFLKVEKYVGLNIAIWYYKTYYNVQISIGIDYITKDGIKDYMVVELKEMVVDIKE